VACQRGMGGWIAGFTPAWMRTPIRITTITRTLMAQQVVQGLHGVSQGALGCQSAQLHARIDRDDEKHSQPMQSYDQRTETVFGIPDIHGVWLRCLR
jgi:hypothetical protein